MICQNCKKNEATVYYKKTVNNKTTEYRLCAECAAKLEKSGEIDMISGFEDDPFFAAFEPFGQSLFNMPLLGSTGHGFGEEKRCPICGMTRSRIEKYGYVGCPECYSVFEKELTPAVLRMHNIEKDSKELHTGKVPAKLFEKFSVKSKIEKLRAKLQKAVESQEFEKAAEYRDMINKLEKEA